MIYTYDSGPYPVHPLCNLWNNDRLARVQYIILLPTHSHLLGGHGNWTSEGCQAVDSNDDNTVRCHCNHLTNFAILVVREFKCKLRPISIMELLYNLAQKANVLSLLSILVANQSH